MITLNSFSYMNHYMEQNEDGCLRHANWDRCIKFTTAERFILRQHIKSIIYNSQGSGKYINKRRETGSSTNTIQPQRKEGTESTQGIFQLQDLDEVIHHHPELSLRYEK